MESQKLAICFFGLSRSLKKTLPSIESCIFNVLKNHNIPYDIYCHTYNLRKIKLKRSHENTILNPDEYKLLNPDYCLVDNQDDFLKRYPTKKIFRYGDPWKTNFQNSKNLLCQLNSLKQVTNMWLKNKDKYFGCIYLRPDLEYKNPISISHLLEIQRNPKKPWLYLPEWHKFNGFNDRLAVCTCDVGAYYGRRLNNALKFCQKNKRPLHAEIFLRWHIKQNKKIVVKPFLLVGIRVRANNKSHQSDVLQLTPISQKYAKQNKNKNTELLDKLKKENANTTLEKIPSD